MNKKIKEQIYSKLFDSSDYLLDNHALLPRSITVMNERVNLKLNETSLLFLSYVINIPRKNQTTLRPVLSR